jgi:hypothetical protein
MSVEPHDQWPRRITPHERLAPVLARGRQRDIGHETRPVPEIVAITRTRADCVYTKGFQSAHDKRNRQIAISLPRVRGYFEEEPT